MLRLTGAIILILSGTYLGWFYGERFDRRLHQMREIRRICQMLQSEIGYSRAPFSYAFCKISGRCNGCFRNWLTAMAKELQEKEEGSMKTVWENNLLYLKGETSLRRKDLECLASLGDGMGFLDMEMQQGAIALFLTEWEEMIKEGRERSASVKKTAFCVGLLGSMMLAILLW